MSTKLQMVSPLVHIISDIAMSRYFIIFSILVQVRQQKRMLSKVWKDLRTVGKTDDIPESLLRKLLFVRSMADSMVCSYEDYVYHFCVENAWKSLQQSLSTAPSFNRIFKIHIKYLDTILESITFGGIKSSSYRVVQKWLETISQLSSLVGFGYPRLLWHV